MTILVLNAGSSSIKFQLYDIGPGDTLSRRFKGQIDGIGTAHPRLSARDGTDASLADDTLDPATAADGEGAQTVLGGWLAQRLGGPPRAVGHRVVHGGPDLGAPALVNDALLAKLQALVPLAPLHQPNNLAPIRSIRARLPALPQVACFDTAFHRGHPDVAERYAIPETLYDEGVRRYGFHGLSYEYIATQLPAVAPDIARGRVVVMHLGSGVSACGIHDGRSIESTMGFTALDGLPMGTRPGQLDPGVVLYLAEQGMAPAAISRLLYHDCGLKGLSGVSNDVRDLLASDSEGARRALRYFAHRIAQAVASLATAMGGLDGIVFTAGVGENAARVRADVCAQLAWLGLSLDTAANGAGGPRISAPDSRIAAYVIPTNEERMIARHTLDVLSRLGQAA